MSNGEDHGLHAFVVKIRDPKTMLPYAGVIVGDLGEKASLNGVDNGYLKNICIMYKHYFKHSNFFFFIRFIMFDKYCIPKESLLSKTGDVNENGQYISPFKDKSKRLGKNY